jgi:polar amino acid transport system substrate-binding protein
LENIMIKRSHRLKLSLGFCSLALLAVPLAAIADTYKLVTLEYPPYEYTENGKVKGLAVEIIKEAFKLMKHEVTIQSYPWARSQAMFEAGDVDGIFTFFKTPAREQFTLFGNEPVVNQPISLWVQKDAKIEFDGDLTKLKAYSFGVVNKVSYGDKFDAAVKEGGLRTDSANTIDSSIEKLVAGRIDIWVSNRYGAVHDLKRMGKLANVRELTPPIQETAAYVGFSKKRNHTALRDDFDKALLNMKQSGAYESLLKKYAR